MRKRLILSLNDINAFGWCRGHEGRIHHHHPTEKEQAMTEDDLKAMGLHETAPIPGETNLFVRRIPNGWLYEYYDFEGNIMIAIPVYETLPIKEQTLPRLL